MLSFLGIGAQKAGTTWLYEQMRLHPEVAFPLGKEAHFWTNPHSVTDQARYLEAFDLCSVKAGEITPAYALLDTDPIRRIHEIAPELRIVYILRDPIARAWSSALMALSRAEMSIDEASDQWFIDHFHSKGSRARGDYQTTLARWRAEFPPDALLVLAYSQIAADPQALLSSVALHLGLAPDPFLALPEENLRQRVFAGQAVPIRESLVPTLERLYRAQMDALCAYLGNPNPW
ncbi:MAG: sulfotransferase [Halochromatium sp.]|nr:sulfotransferase [Halochromatium sp.]